MQCLASVYGKSLYKKLITGDQGQKYPIVWDSGDAVLFEALTRLPTILTVRQTNARSHFNRRQKPENEARVRASTSVGVMTCFLLDTELAYKRMTSSVTRKSSVSFKLAAVSYTVGSTAANCSRSFVSGNNRIMHFINFSIALVFVIASVAISMQCQQ